MLRVGLTGNVAAGKSAVLDLFRQWGAAVVDADVLAREAVAPGTPGLAAVVARFGAGALGPDGTLDRAAMRRRILDDADARRALEAIIHPAVARLGAEREADARAAGAAIVVHDIPLLFEVLDPASFDAVVLVDAPPEVRRERLVRHRGLDAADAHRLIAAQQPSAPKRARATHVIDNAGSREALAASAAEVWAQLQAAAGLA